MNSCKIFLAFLLIIQLTSCSKDEMVVIVINYDAEETINAIVVDTQAGWTFLSERYGFLELIDPLHDGLKIDALKVLATIYKGNIYFDDINMTLDKEAWERDFTFAEIVRIENNESLYNGPTSPIIEIFWSPDYPDKTISYPDGYGFAVQADGFHYSQPCFPEVEGCNFKTEVEAYKVATLVMHCLRAYDQFGTGPAELDFLKIKYVFSPTCC